MPREHRYFVYMLASRRNGTLYVGVTNDLSRRVFEHSNGIGSKFTKKYAVHVLVWYEVYDYVHDAISREKYLKGWNRAWKLRLIESINPEWSDLSSTLL